MTEENENHEIVDLEIIRNQRFMIETARDFIKEVNPWTTFSEELHDEKCITIEEFNKWRRHLLKILGLPEDE